MGLIGNLVKTAVVLGVGYTAYQAYEKSRQESKSVTTDSFLKNFKDQAAVNSKIVVDTVKEKLDSGISVECTISKDDEDKAEAPAEKAAEPVKADAAPLNTEDKAKVDEVFNDEKK